MLKKKLILSFVSFAMCYGQFGFADTCPEVSVIQKHHLQEWQMYDSDENTLLSAKRQAEFIAQVNHFALAEWIKEDQNPGRIHCFYEDKNGSTLEVYLSRPDHIDIAKNNPKYWYPASGLLQCAAQAAQCEFESRKKIDVESGLAKK